MGGVEGSAESEGRISIVYSERFLEHCPGPFHPERPERLREIVRRMKETGIWGKLRVIEPRRAAEEEVEAVHEREYLELLKDYCKTGVPLDLDTPVEEKTYEIAMLAAGGAIVGAQEAMKHGRCFALLRPPGHHASRKRGAGFCYLNNAAIAAEWLKRRGMRRILIFDFDAHCGDGTEEIFYEDSSVLYISFHQDPRTLYPGVGFIWQVGMGDGEGYTINVPFPPGSGDEEYSSALAEIFEPICEQFKPEFVVVSAGFDAHREDPLASLRLSSEAFGWLAQASLKSPALFVLEGGYNLTGLSEGVCNVLKAMMGERFEPPQPRHFQPLDDLKRILSDYWTLK